MTIQLNKESPLTRRREKEKDRRRWEIIEAARKVFFARGYARASMDDIAREAGITKPTVYSYFRAKDELYYTLTLPVIERLNADLKAMRAKMEAGEYASGRDIFRDHFRTYYELFSGDGETFRLFMLFQQADIIQTVEGDIREKINAQVRERYEGMRSIYAAAMRMKLVREVNVYHLVDMLWGSFLGILHSTDMKTLGVPEGAKKHARILKSTLDFAEKVITDALVME